MMMRWTRELVGALERSLDGDVDARADIQALALELFTLRHAKTFADRRACFDAWPVVISSVVFSILVEYDADGLAIAVAGMAPAHRKDKRFIAAVTHSSNLMVTAADVSSVRDCLRSVMAASYPCPRV